ncbi:hypothetical protein FACS1894137_05220 [Spirochaetia bacterium]|nr:hypothetical protein FACS1894137_05220 [Spirochaetia bacterium]
MDIRCIFKKNAYTTYHSWQTVTVIILSLMLFFQGVASASAEPGWTRNPYTVYDRNTYFAATGHGANRREAEQAALAALTASFGQSIQAEFNAMSTYTEAVSKGAVQVSQNATVREAIKTSTALDALIGAEIGDVWDDGAGIVYAAAIMNKSKTAILYADLIRSNQRSITDLITMSDADKNSLDGYSRYQLAAAIADVNRTYANILSLTGNTAGIETGSLKNGDDYRLLAVNITKTIPIAVAVSNDRSDRIRGAFASVLGTAGFRSDGNNPRYVLKVRVNLSEAIMPDKAHKYVRYEIDANLTDTADGAVLLPFNINGREAHTNLPEAEKIAVAEAAKKIKDNYGQLLSGYLSTLLPK